MLGFDSFLSLFFPPVATRLKFQFLEINEGNLRLNDLTALLSSVLRVTVFLMYQVNIEQKPFF